MFRENHINLILLIGLLVVPIIAMFSDEPFIISLSTKVAIFALAGVGLNIALGFGGLVSFGHAAFFGLGGYAAGILASHALNFEPMFNWPFEFSGTTSMPVIWLVALIVTFFAALIIGTLSLRTGGVYFIMITLALHSAGFRFITFLKLLASMGRM